MKALKNLQPPKIKLPLPDVLNLSQNETNGDKSETASVSTEGLIAARPHVVNELLLKLVAINTG